MSKNVYLLYTAFTRKYTKCLKPVFLPPVEERLRAKQTETVRHTRNRTKTTAVREQSFGGFFSTDGFLQY